MSKESMEFPYHLYLHTSLSQAYMPISKHTHIENQWKPDVFVPPKSSHRLWLLTTYESWNDPPGDPFPSYPILTLFYIYIIHMCIYLVGGFNPSEKYESHKIHVPNHQPDINIYIYTYVYMCRYIILYTDPRKCRPYPPCLNNSEAPHVHLPRRVVGLPSASERFASPLSAQTLQSPMTGSKNGIGFTTMTYLCTCTVYIYVYTIYIYIIHIYIYNYIILYTCMNHILGVHWSGSGWGLPHWMLPHARCCGQQSS